MHNGENKLRYTKNQRAFECGFDMKQRKFLAKKKRNKTVLKYENELSKFNSKTCLSKDYKKYLTKRNKVKDYLYTYYNDEIFRKYNWKTYIRTQISESKLINKITSTFGKNFIIGYGNWSENNTKKYNEPTKGKGLRRLLKKEFTVYDVHEYNTSKKCVNCHSTTEKFMRRKNKSNDEYLVNGLLRCKNVICGKYYDRDLNASLNIRNIVLSHIKKNKRPVYLDFTKENIKENKRKINCDKEFTLLMNFSNN